MNEELVRTLSNLTHKERRQRLNRYLRILVRKQRDENNFFPDVVGSKGFVLTKKKAIIFHRFLTFVKFVGDCSDTLEDDYKRIINEKRNPLLVLFHVDKAPSVQREFTSLELWNVIWSCLKTEKDFIIGIEFKDPNEEECSYFILIDLSLSAAELKQQLVDDYKDNMK